jgi:hypothetical protein
MQANTFCFDGDAALAFQVHGVENLLVHFALRQRAGHFEQTVGERGFAVVDVRDDAEIPYELRVHFPRLPIFSMAGRIRIARAIVPAGLLLSNERHLQPACRRRAQKPCRMNNQFATIQRPRQLARRGG